MTSRLLTFKETVSLLSTADESIWEKLRGRQIFIVDYGRLFEATELRGFVSRNSPRDTAENGRC